MSEGANQRSLEREREKLLGEAERIVYRETPEGVALETFVFAPGAGGGRGKGQWRTEDGNPAHGRAESEGGWRMESLPAAGARRADKAGDSEGSVKKDDRGRAAILFFFSSTWDKGTVVQFVPQCMHFAARGMVAFAFDYRVSSRHGTGPLDAIEDVQAAIRWTRANAGQLGVDPERIVVAGGSGGAYLGLMAMLTREEVHGPRSTVDGSGEGDRRRDREEGEEDYEEFSCHPDALVLFSPIVDVSKKGCGWEKFGDPKMARLMSPLYLLRRQDTPPTIIFHAEGDRRVAIAGVRKFASRMRMKRGVCELVEFGGLDHSFFNLNVNERMFEVTLEAADAFLTREGFIEE